MPTRRERDRSEAKRALDQASMLEGGVDPRARAKCHEIARRAREGGRVTRADREFAERVRDDAIRRTTEQYLERDRRGS